VGTERHESRRVDNQLRGRSGRQGDPGSSRFFLSLDDDLMRIFGGENIRAMMDRLGAKEGEVITHALLDRSIAGAQKRVEAQNFEARKHLLEYDDVMNSQRKVVYKLRRRILDGEDVRDEIVARIEDAVDIKVSEMLLRDLLPDDAVWAAHEEDLRRHFTVEYDLVNSVAMGVSKDVVIEEVNALVLAAYGQLEERIGADLRDIERQILLYSIDHLWKAHLYEMDHLKEAIRYRGYGQRDPLSEYKQEGFVLFGQMMERLAFEIAGRVLHIRPEERPQIRQAPRVRYQEVHGEESEKPAAPPPPRPQTAPLLPGTRSVLAQPPSASARPAQGQSFSSASVGRNDPCPCGSGKKFKKCHGEGL